MSLVLSLSVSGIGWKLVYLWQWCGLGVGFCDAYLLYCFGHHGGQLNMNRAISVAFDGPSEMFGR